MVKVEAKNGQVFTQFKSDKDISIQDELGNAISVLLAEFQAQLILNGNPPEIVYGAFQELIGTVIKLNPMKVKESLAAKSEQRNTNITC